jgi:hypothetical protein
MWVQNLSESILQISARLNRGGTPLPQILLAGDLDLIEKGEWGYTEQRHSGNRKNVKSADKAFRMQTLESLAPGILGSSSPTKLEKNQIK